MSWMEFVLAITASLAWPAVVLGAFFMIRREVRKIRRERYKR